MFQPVSAHLRRGTVGTNVRESGVKHCESAVRRTSKRERCVKELVNNNHTLERPSKVKKRNSHIIPAPSLLLVFSRWACKTFDEWRRSRNTSSDGAGRFRFQTARNRNFQPPYVWITLLFDHVVSHFEFV